MKHKLNHFKTIEPLTVGSYTPSDDWSKYTQYAVMEESDCGLVACCGYFQPIHKTSVWSVIDYQEAAECIEQAQLYANASKLFYLVNRMIANCTSKDLIKEANETLRSITDISEPVTRLLGENAISIIEETKKLHNFFS